MYLITANDVEKSNQSIEQAARIYSLVQFTSYNSSSKKMSSIIISCYQ